MACGRKKRVTGLPDSDDDSNDYNNDVCRQHQQLQSTVLTKVKEDKVMAKL